MEKVCPKCGREFGNSSSKCPICNCGLEEFRQKVQTNWESKEERTQPKSKNSPSHKTVQAQPTKYSDNITGLNLDENGVLKMKGQRIAVAIALLFLIIIAVNTFSLYFISIVVFTIILTVMMTNSQKDRIRSTTYFENIVYEGRQKRIQKMKCPTCGNKELGYQRVNDSAFTMVHGKNRRYSTTSISSSQYAICNKCGTDFQVIRRPTPFVNFVFSLMASVLICSVGLIVWVLIF